MKTTLKPYKSKQAIKDALKKANIKISTWAESLIDSDKFTLSKKQDIEYEILTPKDLGFDKYPTMTELYAKAKEKGYDLCPPDFAITLALELEQEKGQWTYMAMEPITGSVGRPRVFDVRRRDVGHRWLYTAWVGLGHTWNLDNRIVFRLRKLPLNSDTVNRGNGNLDTLESRIKSLEDDMNSIKKFLII